MYKSKRKFDLIEDIIILSLSKNNRIMEDIEEKMAVKKLKSAQCNLVGFFYETVNFG